ncbi:MAG: hypothetical protein V1799_03495 [bacterium]
MKTKKKIRIRPEYILNIFPYTIEWKNKQTTLFVMQTLSEFTNFNYQILIDSQLKERLISIKILGLRTTALLMPGVGAARGYFDFPNLKGKYSVKIEKLDGEVNEYTLHIKPDRITLSEPPPSAFIHLSSAALTLIDADHYLKVS